MSGGREGAVRVWDAAGAEGADGLAALGAGAAAQVSNCRHYYAIALFLPGGGAGMDRHKQCASHCSGKSIRSLKRAETLEVHISS